MEDELTHILKMIGGILIILLLPLFIWLVWTCDIRAVKWMLTDGAFIAFIYILTREE